MERICQRRNSAGCDRGHDMFANSCIQIQMLLAHSWLALLVIIDAFVFVLLCLPQQVVGNLQQTHGLH